MPSGASLSMKGYLSAVPSSAQSRSGRCGTLASPRLFPRFRLEAQWKAHQLQGRVLCRALHPGLPSASVSLAF